MKFLIYSSLIFFLYSCSGKGNNNSDATKAEVIKVQPVGTLSSESIYQLTDTFTTQDNKSITLSTFSGKPTVVAMVFTHCPYACPRITSDMVDLE
ncbi:MAG: SCO family protein, partial [Ferruginibacter sp.]